MRLIKLIAAALIMTVSPMTAAVAQDAGTPARTNVRTEIERILNADSESSAQSTPREVAELIATIPQGGAPADFWAAYQGHVLAWAQYAVLADSATQQRLETAIAENAEELAAAETAIDTTFAEVERIARSYGARLPGPRIDPNSVA